MDNNEFKQWRCVECGVISLETALLTAQNPFDAKQSITGCPTCKNVGVFEEICDERGCDKAASCGFPIEDGFGGYRRTCHKHSNITRN